MDELQMLEPINFVDPCERAKVQFAQNGSRRIMNLSELKSEKGHCVWCDGPLEGRRSRWCSDACVYAALFLANPQSPGAKAFRLIHEQTWACKACGLSFEDELRKRIRRRWETENRIGALISEFNPYRTRKRTEKDPEYKVTYSFVGDNTGHLFQTDHIIPVYKGGAGIDPQNLQVLCVPCHKIKTKEDKRVN